MGSTPPPIITITCDTPIEIAVGGEVVMNRKPAIPTEDVDDLTWWKRLSVAPHVLDEVPVEHLKKGHRPAMIPQCSVCLLNQLRSRLHVRGAGNENASDPGQMSGDLFGKVGLSVQGNEWGLVAVKRNTRFGFFSGIPARESLVVLEAISGWKLDLRKIWRFHSDVETAFAGHLENEFKKRAIVLSDTGGYDSAGNSIAEGRIRILVLGARCLMGQAGTPESLWDLERAHEQHHQPQRAPDSRPRPTYRPPLHGAP